jgi:hypothetical protein
LGSSEPGVIARCKTLDISRDGLRVTLEQQLQIGAILQLGVELPAPTDHSTWWARSSGATPYPAPDPIGRQASRC